MKHYDITPMAKPRMTRRDGWTKARPVVEKYRAFKTECRVRNLVLPSETPILVFYMPMPASWSNRKQCRMISTAHRQTPDVDNMIKAVLDAVLVDDKTISSVWALKIWSADGAIRVGDQRNHKDREKTLELLAQISA